MTDFHDAAELLEACAMMVAQRGYAYDEREAWKVLRMSGHSNFFLGSALEEIMRRARELSKAKRVH